MSQPEVELCTDIAYGFEAFFLLQIIEDGRPETLSEFERELHERWGERPHQDACFDWLKRIASEAASEFREEIPRLHECFFKELETGTFPADLLFRTMWSEPEHCASVQAMRTRWETMSRYDKDITFLYELFPEQEKETLWALAGNPDRAEYDVPEEGRLRNIAFKAE